MDAERPWTRYSFKIHPMEFGHPEERGNPLLGNVGIINHYMIKNPHKYHHPIQESCGRMYI
jgi:hypothetical protein